MTKLRGLGVAAGCAVGGASARFVVPPANAQQAATLTRWEHYCIRHDDETEVAQASKRLGAEGWELVTEDRPEYCFKRPKM